MGIIDSTPRHFQAKPVDYVLPLAGTPPPETVFNHIEEKLGRFPNLKMQSKSHYLNREEILSLFDGQYPDVIMGEISEGDTGFDATLKDEVFVDTSYIQRAQGIGGFAEEKREHYYCFRELLLHSTVCATDIDPFLSQEQLNTQDGATLARLFIALAPPVASWLGSFKSVLNGERYATRRMFLKGMMAGALSLSASRIDLGRILSEQERDPTYFQYHEFVVTFRNFMMVQSSLNILSRLAVSNPNASILFTAAAGHNVTESACSTLFASDFEVIESKIRDYARRAAKNTAIELTTNTSFDETDIDQIASNAKLTATLFSVPYQLGAQLPQEQYEVSDTVLSPCLIFIEELKRYIQENAPSHTRALDKVLLAIIERINQNYVASRKWNAPLYAIAQENLRTFFDDYYLCPQDYYFLILAATNRSIPVRVVHLISESAYQGLPAHPVARYFSTGGFIDFCGVGEVAGLPVPLLSIRQFHDFPPMIVAELPDGSLTQVRDV